MSSQNPSLNDLLDKNQQDDSGAGGKLQKKLKSIQQGDVEQNVTAAAAAAGLPYINLDGFPISDEAISTMPKETAAEMQTVCFLNTGDEIRLGTVEYSEKIKELGYQLGERFHAGVKIYLISEKSFDTALKIYDRLPKLKKVERGIRIEESSLEKFHSQMKNLSDVQPLIADANISEMIDLLIAAAILSGASDFHIETEKEAIKIRFRIDGILNEIAEIPGEQWKQLIDRIKLLAGLKINIIDKPQDGRYSIHTEKFGEIDVRVSTIPTNFGESVVMRLLLSSKMTANLTSLGLRDADLKTVNQQISRPNGMILVTGPTGSGKTTTLYAVLLELNKPDIKIITLEDPIEYQIAGINQSQIDPSKNYSFASGLRSILRQDPDIIMIGEIRDLETAETAINASLTGHLLLSTVHTNSAAGAVLRLLAMDVKPFLLAPALNLIVAQRLVRVLCNKCKEKTDPTAEQLERAKQIISRIPENNVDRPDPEHLVFYKAAGCSHCGNIGYKGRIGLFEIIVITDEIKKMIDKDGTSEINIETEARKNGMLKMVEDGVLKASQGLTTLEEVFRVTE